MAEVEHSCNITIHVTGDKARQYKIEMEEYLFTRADEYGLAVSSSSTGYHTYAKKKEDTKKEKV